MNTHKLLTYALNSQNQLVHIDSVPNGSSCNCFCPNCKAALIAKNGKDKRQHHFAHEANSDCLKGYQTALHILGKEIIIKEKLIPIFNEKFQFELLQADSIELEKKIGDIIPDVYAIINNKPVAIEILVTHEVDDVKYRKIEMQELTTIEIDLSKIESLDYGLVKAELYKFDNMKLIYDKNFYDGIINLKKEIILKKGIQRKVENGTVRSCPMSCLVTRQGIIPRTINSKLCDLCILWYKPENSENFYCVGHTNDNLPSWFVQADVINNKYLPINEAVRKIKTFKENIKRYSL